MAEAVAGDGGFFGIDEVGGVAGVGPGMGEVFSGENFADVLAGARVVDDGVALGGEADANDEVAAGSGAFAAETIVAKGEADGQAACYAF